MFEKEVDLNFSDVRKGRRKRREHFIGYVLHVERLLDVLGKKKALSACRTLRERFEPHRPVPSTPTIPALERDGTYQPNECSSEGKTYYQLDDKRPWQSMVQVAKDDSVAIVWSTHVESSDFRCARTPFGYQPDWTDFLEHLERELSLLVLLSTRPQ